MISFVGISLSDHVPGEFSSRRFVTQLRSLTFHWSKAVLFGYGGARLCLLVYNHRDSTLPLKGRWHLEVDLTGLKQTDLKLGLTSLLLKLMWGTEDLKRLNKQPWHRQRTINACKHSLNLLSILSSYSRFRSLKTHCSLNDWFWICVCAYDLYLLTGFCNVCACAYIYTSGCPWQDRVLLSRSDQQTKLWTHTHILNVWLLRHLIDFNQIFFSQCCTRAMHDLSLNVYLSSDWWILVSTVWAYPLTATTHSANTFLHNLT